MPALRLCSALAISAAAAAAPASAQERKTVTVAMHYTQEQAAPLIACLQRYGEEHAGVTVEYQQLSYRDYLQTVLTSRLGGQSADIYNLYSIWGAQMVDNGVLDEPPAEIADFVRGAYLEGTVEAATIEGELRGVPTEVSVYMLVSNMRLLREAGYDAPPTTWDELVEVAAAVTKRNAQDRIETAGFAFAESSTGAGLVHPFYAMLYSQGAAAYADDFSEANLDGPEAAEALARQRELIASGATDRTVDGYDFPAGGIGMIVMANWLEADIRSGFGERFDQDVAVSPIPMDEDWRTLQYAFFMGVDSNSDVKAEAWDVIRYVNSEASATDGGASCMGETLDAMGALTANTADRAALGEMDAFTAAYWEALQDGRAISQPNVMQAAEIESMMAVAIDRALAGEVEPAEAMRELDAAVEDVLSEFY